MVDKWMYNTTLSQVFSPCGNFLLAGNVYGDIAVFDLANILNPTDGVGNYTKPLYYFSTPRCEQICSLSSTSKFLIVGTVGEITGWDWSTICSTRHPKVSWTIQIPFLKDTIQKADVNSMLVSDNGTGTFLYTGCGDNKIHVFSLEDGRHVRSMEGHDDYIHSIDSLGWQLVSGGEDGTVRLWDMRQSVVTGVITPYENAKITRLSSGKWIGDVAINDDWLVCGGGPLLSLWHLRSLDVMTAFTAVEDTGLHVTKFYDDRILAGGCAKYFYHLTYNGEISAQVEVSATTIYSAVYQETPHRVMCLAGSSRYIDLCTNFAFRDQLDKAPGSDKVIHLYSSEMVIILWKTSSIKIMLYTICILLLRLVQDPGHFMIQNNVPLVSTLIAVVHYVLLWKIVCSYLKQRCRFTAEPLHCPKRKTLPGQTWLKIGQLQQGFQKCLRIYDPSMSLSTVVSHGNVLSYTFKLQ